MLKRSLLKILLRMTLPFGLVVVFGCANVFSEMADKTTDAARKYQARMLLNTHDFTGAIAALNKMTSAGLAEDESQVLLASAYAGRCGLDAITLAQNLSNGNGNLFSVLFSGFPGSTASQVTDCQTARTILAALVSPSADVSLFLALVAFATIGAELNYIFDLDHNGIVDTPVHQCAAAPMSNAQATDIGVNIAYALVGLTGLGSALAGSANAITTLCATPGVPVGICNKTDPTGYTAADIKALRAAITSSDYIGLGNCSDYLSTMPPATLANCICP